MSSVTDNNGTDISVALKRREDELVRASLYGMLVDHSYICSGTQLLLENEELKRELDDFKFRYNGLGSPTSNKDEALHVRMSTANFDSPHHVVDINSPQQRYSLGRASRMSSASNMNQDTGYWKELLEATEDEFSLKLHQSELRSQNLLIINTKLSDELASAHKRITLMDDKLLGVMMNPKAQDGNLPLSCDEISTLVRILQDLVCEIVTPTKSLTSIDPKADIVSPRRVKEIANNDAILGLIDQDIKVSLIELSNQSNIYKLESEKKKPDDDLSTDSMFSLSRLLIKLIHAISRYSSQVTFLLCSLLSEISSLKNDNIQMSNRIDAMQAYSGMEIMSASQSLNRALSDLALIKETLTEKDLHLEAERKRAKKLEDQLLEFKSVIGVIDNNNELNKPATAISSENYQQIILKLEQNDYLSKTSRSSATTQPPNSSLGNLDDYDGSQSASKILFVSGSPQAMSSTHHGLNNLQNNNSVSNKVSQPLAVMLTPNSRQKSRFALELSNTHSNDANLSSDSPTDQDGSPSLLQLSARLKPAKSQNTLPTANASPSNSNKLSTAMLPKRNLGPRIGTALKKNNLNSSVSSGSDDGSSSSSSSSGSDSHSSSSGSSASDSSSSASREKVVAIEVNIASNIETNGKRQPVSKSKAKANGKAKAKPLPTIANLKRQKSSSSSSSSSLSDTESEASTNSEGNDFNDANNASDHVNNIEIETCQIISNSENSMDISTSLIANNNHMHQNLSITSPSVVPHVSGLQSEELLLVSHHQPNNETSALLIKDEANLFSVTTHSEIITPPPPASEEDSTEILQEISLKTAPVATVSITVPMSLSSPEHFETLPDFIEIDRGVCPINETSIQNSNIILTSSSCENCIKESAQREVLEKELENSRLHAEILMETAQDVSILTRKLTAVELELSESIKEKHLLSARVVELKLQLDASANILQTEKINFEKEKKELEEDLESLQADVAWYEKKTEKLKRRVKELEYDIEQLQNPNDVNDAQTEEGEETKEN